MPSLPWRHCGLGKKKKLTVAYLQIDQFQNADKNDHSLIKIEDHNQKINTASAQLAGRTYSK